MGWHSYGGVDQGSALGVYADVRVDDPGRPAFGFEDYEEAVPSLSRPGFLDQTPPVPNIVTESATVVSKQVGYDTINVYWYTDKQFAAYRFEQVSGPAAAVFSGTLLASGVGAAGSNLMPNPSFEKDAVGSTTPAAWTMVTSFGTSTGLSNTVSTAWSKSGSNSLLVSVGSIAAGDFVGPDSLNNLIPVMAGDAFSASAWVKDSGTVPAGVYYNILVNWYSGATYKQNVGLAAGVTPNGGPQQLALSGTVPTGLGINGACVSIVFYNYSGGAGAAGAFYVDAVQYTNQSVVPPYGDGDQPGWSWSGVAGNSASVGPPGSPGRVNTTQITGESLTGADGADTIKLFVQDFAGNWST